MVEKIPTQKVISNLQKATTLVYWEDTQDSISTTGVVVDEDTYNAGSFLDRAFDVRTFKELSTEIENIGASSILVTILGTTKDFDDLDTDLVIGDFDLILSAEETIAAAAKMATPFEKVKTTPLITAMLVRAKEAVAANPGTVRADIKFLPHS